MGKSDIQNQTIEGTCYCGQVQYQVQLPVKWCAHCHCTQCRHIQGTPVVTWFGVDKSNFIYLLGEKEVNWFDSSDYARRGRCKHCGTPLFFLGEKWQDEIHITLESTQQNIQILPKAHVFYDRHVDYLQFNDNLEKYGGVDGFRKLKTD